jgi:hypothetical protein
VKKCLAAALVFLSLALPAFSSENKTAESKVVDRETVDLEMVTRIRFEAFHNSKVMETLSELTDRFGPRLTGSPAMKKAAEWTREQLTSWGLSNAHLESWPFGRSWSNDFISVRMTSPAAAALIAVPEGWSPGTPGVIHGKAIKVKLQTDEDLEKNKGKLAGMIVLNGDAREVKPHTEAEMRRYDPKALEELYSFIPPPPEPEMEQFLKLVRFQRKLERFFDAEKPLAIIQPSGRGDGGSVRTNFTPWRFQKEAPQLRVPELVMAVEHYNRLARLLDRKLPVELELDVRNEFHEGAMGYNVLAEIPGGDKKDEVVMLGAHLDSTHAGTGATDDAAGVAVMMEAVRVLKVLGVKPRRTIRVAVWDGEEQGLLGSRNYALEHFASMRAPAHPERGDVLPADLLDPGSFTPKPEHAKISGYFNVDNGTGMLRGVYLQENAAVRPIFEAWMEPLRDLGLTTLSMRNTGGTDHLAFDAVGIPGFQFIQDPIEYSTRTHHTNMDVYDRIQANDMKQAAAVVASFVYHAAMRDQILPRKPLPKAATQ